MRITNARDNETTKGIKIKHKYNETYKKYDHKLKLTPSTRTKENLELFA